MKPSTHLLAFTLMILSACSQEQAPDPTNSLNTALNVAQCHYFAVNNKVQICHRTNSVKNPYVIINVNVEGCINGHVIHDRDYIAVNDPTCQGGGCLPEGAPCDSTLPCCSGSICQAGTCVQVCKPTSCETTARQKMCGFIPDGCGDELNCGGCDEPLTCGGGGVPNFCGCTRTTCEAQGANCGSIPDGCGSSLSCGSCEAPLTCGGGERPNVCGCTRTTCVAQGAKCGMISDGCGGFLDCGPCQDP